MVCHFLKSAVRNLEETSDHTSLFNHRMSESFGFFCDNLCSLSLNISSTHAIGTLALCSSVPFLSKTDIND